MRDVTQLPQVVRERIPELLRRDGQDVRFEEAATDDVWLMLLTDKLDQLVKSYMASGEVECLVDLLDAIYALAEARKVTKRELILMATAKTTVLGGFGHRKVLLADS